MSEVVKVLAEALEDIVSESSLDESGFSPKGKPGSIYNKYGGWNFFKRIIFELYIELVDRPEISHHFIGVDIDKLSTLQTQFLCQAIGGPQKYSGKSLANVHRFLGISEFQFSIVADRFAQIFRDNGLNSEEVKTIMDFVLSHRQEIVTQKMARIDRVMRSVYGVVNYICRLFRGKK
jgi:hemoglobin